MLRMSKFGDLIAELVTAGVEPGLVGRVAELGVYGPACGPVDVGAPAVPPEPYRPPELAGARSMFETVFGPDGDGAAEPGAVPRDEYGLKGSV